MTFLRKDEKGPLVYQTCIETVSKANTGKMSERRAGVHMGFSKCIDYRDHLELN